MSAYRKTKPRMTFGPRSCAIPGRLMQVSIVLLALAVAVSTASALTVDNEPENVVRDGGFESGAVSLVLPAGERMPLVVGGWASRGDRPPRIVRAPARTGADRRAIRLASGPRRPVELVQDLPVGGRGYVLELEVARDSGTQQVRLLHEWSRDGTGGEGLSVTVRGNGLLVETAAGSFAVRYEIPTKVWTSLRLRVDPRDDRVTVFIDRNEVASLPGVPAQPPRTLVIGGDERGRFRYDDVRVFRLFDLELGAVRRAMPRVVDEDVLPALMARLDDAMRAARSSSRTVAAIEMRATLRLLLEHGGTRPAGPAAESSPGSGDVANGPSGSADVAGALQRIVDLLTAS